MMMTGNILYKKEMPVNDKISIYIPTVGEVVDNENAYYSLVTAFTAMPIDLMVMLDDMGVDFTSITEYELFTYLFPGIASQDTSLIFRNMDLSNFQLAVNEDNHGIVFVDRENDIVIDRNVHSMIASALRKIHHLEKNRRKPANKEAKEYMIERARIKQKRFKKKAAESHIEPLIIAMVNTEQYKYDYEGTRNLSIYQFNESVRQVIKKVDYDNKMYGVYTGSINAKDLSQDDLNWLVHK